MVPGAGMEQELQDIVLHILLILPKTSMLLLVLLKCSLRYKYKFETHAEVKDCTANFVPQTMLSYK